MVVVVTKMDVILEAASVAAMAVEASHLSQGVLSAPACAVGIHPTPVT